MKFVIYGDSISTSEIGGGGYAKWLRAMLPEWETVSFAVSASRAGSGTPGSVSGVLELHPPENADAVLLWHGTNDWYWGTPPGEAGCGDPDTYVGAMELATAAIRAAAPGASLFYGTPLYRLQAPDGGSAVRQAWTCPNRCGKTLADYEEALWAMSRRLCVPVIDFRLESGIHAQNQPDLLPDGVHPSAEGCRRLAASIARRLRGLENDP